jgi:hypothetical protein
MKYLIKDPYDVGLFEVGKGGKFVLGSRMVAICQSNSEGYGVDEKNRNAQLLVDAWNYYKKNVLKEKK